MKKYRITYTVQETHDYTYEVECKNRKELDKMIEENMVVDLGTQVRDKCWDYYETLDSVEEIKND